MNETIIDESVLDCDLIQYIAKKHILAYEKGKHSQTDSCLSVNDHLTAGYMYAKQPFQ